MTNIEDTKCYCLSKDDSKWIWLSSFLCKFVQLVGLDLIDLITCIIFQCLNGIACSIDTIIFWKLTVYNDKLLIFFSTQSIDLFSQIQSHNINLLLLSKIRYQFVTKAFNLCHWFDINLFWTDWPWSLLSCRNTCLVHQILYTWYVISVSVKLLIRYVVIQKPKCCLL